MTVDAPHDATHYTGTESYQAHEASYDRTTGTVHSIEHDLGSKTSDKMSPHVRDEIYQGLNGLRTHDKNFKEDLVTINARLQHDGYLPNMYIVGNTSSDHASASESFGPNSKDGFHLSTSESAAALAAKDAKIDYSTHHAPKTQLAPGEVNQSTWAQQNPGNPVGSDGGNGNVGGSTPISGSSVESSPVAGGILQGPQLQSEIQQALQLLNAQRAAEGLPPIAASAQNMKDIEEIITHESSGNPNAQNNSDINAQNGDPSRGLMQTIGTTFSQYHVKGTSSNIFDPVANIAAGVNYAVSRYGSLDNVPGVKSLAGGGAYVGY